MMRNVMHGALVGTFAVLMGGTAVSFAVAQEYPVRPINVIVPYAAGGQTDLAGRLIADALTEELGQTATVVNRPGAGGVTGTAELAAATPDGYTLGLATSTPILQRPHISDTPYTYEDFDYICRVNHNPLLFTVQADSDIQSIEDLIEMARSGTRVTYGSSGEASVQHVAMTTLATQADIEMVHVPNTSDTENLRNILAGVITGTLVPASVAAANIDTIRPIGLMDNERLADYPDIPTFAEAGYEVTAAVWGILAGPKGLDEDVLSKLRQACADAQAKDSFRENIVRLGMQPSYLDSEESFEMVERETQVSLEALERLGFAN